MKPKLLVIIVATILSLSLVQLIISHNLATAGGKVRTLEAEINRLEKENALLASEINKTASLSRIAVEAGKIGLSKATHIFHLAPEVPVAMNR